MKPAPFEYVAPRSLEGALEALSTHGGDGKILAGGQSLMPLLNFRLVKPACMIDLNRIPELSYIKIVGGDLAIGAMTRQSAVERSQVVHERCPLLAEAIKYIGHVAIRHRGTVGGSLVHADPAAELPAVALALEAYFDVVGPHGSRKVSAEEFFVDYMTTAVGPEEILREIIFPILSPSMGYAVLEVARRHGDFALVGAASALALDESGNINNVRIALFGVGPRTVRACQAEASLKGQWPDPTSFQDAAKLAQDELDPFSDVHASAAYRRQVACVLVERSLEKALSRVRNGRERDEKTKL